MLRADNLATCMCRVSRNSRRLKLLDSFRTVETCKVMALPFTFCFCFWHNSPTRARAASCSRFCKSHTMTQHRTPLDKGLARHRDLYLYLTTLNTHKRQTSMPSEEFEPAIPTSDLLHSLSKGKGKGVRRQTEVAQGVPVG